MTKSKRGFTLLEVLIALVIVLGGVLVVGQSWSGNFLRVRKTNLYNNVSLLLQRKMTELEAFYYSKPIDQIPDSDAGDFGSDYPQYRWEMISQEFEFPDLSSVLVGRDQGADDMLLTMMKQMQEYISKSVKEVTVKVFVKTPTREMEYSITTYFVDYKKNASIGPGASGGP